MKIVFLDLRKLSKFKLRKILKSVHSTESNFETSRSYFRDF
ncbi:hypothetical protein LEP1GSC064_2783 [Leptospira kirschneri serovar Grippotyphosa str. Moskva]|nr:hypothetical protein LEP1GSC044_0156 [Leptospira kirschneri serovar Grippotyphosa str. RM52]EKQ84595.1 hypothetical protein LEP1GSC064_2783 [Leptospira kirschneri serovar Grippotyphosa str. Moskva]EMN27008.1 hypothetical protein LEP1GSC065_0798 [Leptospira kirschneri serovar Sokoine str. RM1]